MSTVYTSSICLQAGQEPGEQCVTPYLRDQLRRDVPPLDDAYASAATSQTTH